MVNDVLRPRTLAHQRNSLHRPSRGVYYISDPASNVRRKPHTQIWQVERFLGNGGFREVRLERNTGDGKARAVKRFATTSASLSNTECEKELEALLEFSKPKVAKN